MIKLRMHWGLWRQILSYLISFLTVLQKCCLLGFSFKMKARKEYFNETLCHSWKELSITAILFFVCLFYKGSQKNILGMLEITQRELRIYSANNDVGFCAYLCTTAVCFSFAQGRTSSLCPKVQALILHNAVSWHPWYYRHKQILTNFQEKRTENWSDWNIKPLGSRKFVYISLALGTLKLQYLNQEKSSTHLPALPL